MLRGTNNTKGEEISGEHRVFKGVSVKNAGGKPLLRTGRKKKRTEQVEEQGIIETENERTVSKISDQYKVMAVKQKKRA